MKKHKYYYRNKLPMTTKYFIKMKNINILKKNYKINKTIRQKLIIKSYNINKNFSMYKLKKYCYFTGRLRFIISNQKVSRMTFRDLVSKGLFPGYYKK